MNKYKKIAILTLALFSFNSAFAAPAKKAVPKRGVASKSAPVKTTNKSAPVADTGSGEYKAHVYQVERKIEEDLSSKIKTIFGAGSRISVSVKATPDETKAASGNETPKMTDVGYVPFPVDLNGRENAGKGSQNGAFIPLKSLEVKLHVAEQLSVEEQGHLKSMVEQSLSNLPAKVELIPIKLASDAVAKPEQTRPIVDKLLSALPFLVGSLLIFFAILLFTKSLSLSAKAISEALMSMRIKEDVKHTQVSEESEAKGDGEASAAANTTANANERSSATDDQSTHTESYLHHLSLFKRMIKESPIAVMQTVKESIQESSSEFSFHFRKLMVRLGEEDLEAAKKCLSEEDLESIRSDEQSTSNQDHASWLGEFCEKLVVKKVSGGSSLERLMGTEFAREFYAVDPDVLAEIARNTGTQAGWRIASEFLPKEKLSQIFGAGDAGLKNLMITAAAVKSEEVQITIPEMVEKIRNTKQSIALENDEYNDLIAHSLITELTTRPMSEWDQGVAEFKELSAEVGKLISEQFWTPSKIAQVPDQYLSQSMKSLKPEQKAKLIAGFPDPHSKRLLGFIPEGQGRVIVEDMISKLRRKNDIEALKEYCGDFLKRLQKDSKEGNFKLTLLAVVEPEQNTTEEKDQAA